MSGPQRREGIGPAAGAEGRPMGGIPSSVVYLAPKKPGGPLRAESFVAGLSDGQYVQVKRGDLHDGESVVVGIATAQGQEAGGLAGMTPFGRRRR